MWLERHVYDQSMTFIASQFCMYQWNCTRLIAKCTNDYWWRGKPLNIKIWLSCFEPSLWVFCEAKKRKVHRKPITYCIIYNYMVSIAVRLRSSLPDDYWFGKRNICKLQRSTSSSIVKSNSRSGTKLSQVFQSSVESNCFSKPWCLSSCWVLFSHIFYFPYFHFSIPIFR